MLAALTFNFKRAMNLLLRPIRMVFCWLSSGQNKRGEQRFSFLGALADSYVVAASLFEGILVTAPILGNKNR